MTIEQANRLTETVELVDKQLSDLPQSELMKVDEVYDLLLDLRNILSTRDED